MSREGERPLQRWLELRDEIKRRIDYRSFYLRYCPEARQTGARLQALCPIPAHAHSGRGHPSLSVDLQQGLFNCFSRGEGGDALTFYQLMHGVTFAGAVRMLARDLGVGEGRVRGGSDSVRRPSLAGSRPPTRSRRMKRPETSRRSTRSGCAPSARAFWRCAAKRSS